MRGEIPGAFYIFRVQQDRIDTDAAAVVKQASH